MSPEQVADARHRIEAETDPTLKNLMLASWVTAEFREHGIDLVVVGGSAIEFYTEGAYTSGDVDLCLLPGSSPLSLRQRQEVMGGLGAEGGPRNWRLAGLFVDVLGPLETSAHTRLRLLEGPFGPISLIQPEDLIAERVLVSVYPRENAEARDLARKLLAVALSGHLSIDWRELWRVAARPEYAILQQCRELVASVAHELGIADPAHSPGSSDLVE